MNKPQHKSEQGRESASAKILVIGATGQVGLALKEILGDRALLWGREQLNFADPAQLREKILALKPEVVINAAAYTKVDQAESEETLAYEINALAPFALAQACYEVGASFVTYSTDYVYSGEGTQAWCETDQIAPQNAYGRTKAQGERLILDWAPADFRFLILRTSWVYSFIGKNFLLTMLKLGSEREDLKVVADQVGAPTYAPHLAKISLELLEKLKSSTELSGVYNVCGTGETSWFGFAEEIFLQARQMNFNMKLKNLTPQASSQYPTPAKRPLNSRMNQDKLRSVLGHQSPEWEIGLAQCLLQVKAMK